MNPRPVRPCSARAGGPELCLPPFWEGARLVHGRGGSIPPGGSATTSLWRADGSRLPNGPKVAGHGRPCAGQQARRLPERPIARRPPALPAGAAVERELESRPTTRPPFYFFHRRITAVRPAVNREGGGSNPPGGALHTIMSLSNSGQVRWSLKPEAGVRIPPGIPSFLLRAGASGLSGARMISDRVFAGASLLSRGTPRPFLFFAVPASRSGWVTLTCHVNTTPAAALVRRCSITRWAEASGLP